MTKLKVKGPRSNDLINEWPHLVSVTCVSVYVFATCFNIIKDDLTSID